MSNVVTEFALVALFGALCVGLLSPGAALAGVLLTIVVYLLLGDGGGPTCGAT